jgi:hypothetical protein
MRASVVVLFDILHSASLLSWCTTIAPHPQRVSQLYGRRAFSQQRSRPQRLTYCLVKFALEVAASAACIGRLDVIGIKVEHGCKVRDGLIQPSQLLKHRASVVQRVHIVALILQNDVVVG